MPLTLQNILVLCLVLLCIAIVARQAFRTLAHRAGAKLGSCCAKGCEAHEKTALKTNDKPKPVHFMPVEMLSRRR